MSHRAFCEKFLVAITAGDFKALGEMLAPDFIVTEADGLPYAGIYRGLEGWRDLSKAVVTTWAGFKAHLIEYLGETSDTIVVRFAISGQSRKTGVAFQTTVLELWRFRDNRICEIMPYYWDSHYLAVVNGL